MAGESVQVTCPGEHVMTPDDVAELNAPDEAGDADRLLAAMVLSLARGKG